ncbi:CHAT domain-containing protein [Nonomuraea sp. NPDC046802]|uniref:CHAT domain-containing protein n=1 Tax=Nonomuraea sp. NPDC046802 TaxID=3154919 RepID=UPI0033D3CB45
MSFLGQVPPESLLPVLERLGSLGRVVAVLSPILLIPAAGDLPVPMGGLFLLTVGLLVALGLLRSDRGRHLPSFARGIYDIRQGGTLAGLVVFAHTPAGEWLVRQWLDRPWLTGWAGGLLLAALTLLCAVTNHQELGTAVVVWPQPSTGVRFGSSGWTSVASFFLLPIQIARIASGSGALPLFLAGFAAPRPVLVQAAFVTVLAEVVITLAVRWWLNDFGTLIDCSMMMVRLWPRLGDALAHAWVQDRLIARTSSCTSAPDYSLLIMLAAQAPGAPDSRRGRRLAPGYLSLCESMLRAAETSFLAGPGIEEQRREELRRLHLAARGTVSLAFATVADGEGAVDEAVARSSAAVADLEMAGYPDFAALTRLQWADRLRNDYLAVREVLRPITEDGQGLVGMSAYAHLQLAYAARFGAPERVAFHQRAESDERRALEGRLPRRMEGWFPRSVAPSVPDVGIRTFERLSWEAWRQIYEYGEPVSWTGVPDAVQAPESGSVDQPGLNVASIKFFGESRASMSVPWNMLCHAQLLARARRLRTARWLLAQARTRSSDIFLQHEALALLAAIDEEEKDWAAAFARWSELVRLEESRRGRITDVDQRIDYQAAHYSRLILLLTWPGRGHVPGLPALPSAVAFDHSERDRSRVLLESLRLEHSTGDDLSKTIEYAELTRLLQKFERQSGQRVLLASFYVFHARVIVFVVRSGSSSPVVEQGEPPPGLLLPDAPNAYGRMTSAAAFEQDRLNSDFGALIETVARHSTPGELLCLVPHGVLHEVPLHAVATGGVPLAVRNPVHVVPSASLLAGLYRDTAPPAPREVCVFADSRPELPLMHARAEARSLAEAFGERSDVISGERVTRQAVLDRLVNSEATALHFACHGVLAPDDRAGSAISCADGPLTMDDLLGLRFRADLVTLSACRSGASRGRPGDERLGLARAFLLAGAKSVLVTQWQVDDLSTALFMERFYELLVAGAPRGQALHEAQATVRGMTMDSVRRWCENALAHATTSGAEADAAERRAYELTLLRLLCASGELSAAKRKFDHLKQHTRSASPERRELMVLWSRLMASAKAGRDVDRCSHPFEHPYFWAPFVLIGDAR